MRDFSKEVMAYSLQNAIDFGKANPEKILPKLFQHELEKKDIGKVMPLVKETVKKVNSMSVKERVTAFSKLKKLVKKREEQERDLVELPGSAMKRKLIFRLAPFPSGALHIGNAKTYILNALYAERYKGDLLLVMDDTIGSAEKPLIEEGYQLIEEDLELVGIKYKKPIIYKSDRLKIYYKYAKDLIEKNKAYVCYCSQEELRENREKGVECSCRQFPVKIQLLRWKEMFKAKEGHATLRIKTSMFHPNPAFRDRVLFKISEREHPRVEKKYRVWPSLEMSWAIDDHLLGITHIIRGNDLMIETEMEKYIWDIFHWKGAETIHTGLIRIEKTGAKISKAKSQKEVLSGEFLGWDDPRTWSIRSLIRRGITKEAIREFVKEIGLNKQDITVPIETLYAINRGIIDYTSERYSFIENPKKIEIEKNPGIKEPFVPIHPDKPKKTRKVKLTNNIFISGKDFEKYKGKEIRLLYLFNLRLGEKSKFTSLKNKKIPKLNWVSVDVPARILMPNGDWISGIAEEGINKLYIGQIIQFERFGFCRYDGKRKNIYEFWFAHK
ncbi:MAG: glutamate--tRNA ligase [Nanoarchaeota archaeon]|nr:glutamate--tRNA ligase [Nanoarchaeota archaeon]